MTAARSVVAAVNSCLAAIARREPEVRAWVHLDEPGALRRAAELDAEGPQPLTGLTVGLKDLIDTAAMPTAYGSPIYRDHRPNTDAAIVGLLERAGVCVVGKTVTTEFALMVPGSTVNPRRAGHSPGGSSSGSAAAVAAGMVDIAIGTQTYGSVIRPAGYCGVYGFTPSFGTVPMTGIRPMAPRFDKIGWFARSLDEIDAAHEALTGERAAPDRPVPRVGVLKLAGVDGLAAEVRAIEPLLHAALGDRADVVELALLPELAEVTRLHHAAASWEIALSLRAEYEGQPDRVSAPVREFVRNGLAVSQLGHDAAVTELAVAAANVLRVFDEVDVVITPATIDEAPAGLAFTGDPLFCTPWTALGCPALTVPGLTGATGLPLGLQVVAAPGQDCRALDSARALQLDHLPARSQPGRR